MKKLFQNQNAWLWVVFVLLAVNVVTMDLYTSVWMDEVVYTQPAANAYLGMGFTSSAWESQSKDAFWISNVPLYPLLLWTWFKIAGFGIFQTRVLDYFLWSLAVCFFCLAARRFGWVRTTWGLSLLAALSFLGSGVTFSFRSGRYDPLAVLLVCFCLLAFSFRRPAWRYSTILVTCAFFLPAYLALGPFCALMMGLVWLTTGGKYVRESIAMGMGLIIGFGGLYVFYQHFGVWDDFLRAIRLTSQTYYNREAFRQVHVGLGTIITRKLTDSITVLFKDRESVLLMLAAVLPLAVMRKREVSAGHAKLIPFILLVFFAIPIGLLMAFAFPIYYWWMRYLPLCVAFVISAETLHRLGQVTIRNILIFGGIGLVSVLGLPARLLLSSLDLSERNYSKVESFVNNSIKETDVVYADYQAFYPLQRLRGLAYYPGYLVRMTPAEAATINCLVVDPAEAPDLEERFGGVWMATGQEYLHPERFGVALLDRFLPNYFKGRTNLKYNLAIYRKVTPTANNSPQ